MQFSVLLLLSLPALFSTTALSIPSIGFHLPSTGSTVKSDPVSLYNKHKDVILQEPIEKVQRRVDHFAALDRKEAKEAEEAEVQRLVRELENKPGLRKRGLYSETPTVIKKSRHAPKYRPTGTAIPPLQTDSWEQLAVIKKRIERQSDARKSEMQ